MPINTQEPKWIVGWREWIALPELDVTAIKVKIDTGARSSALHAFDVERFRRGARSMVRFRVAPLQRDDRAVRAEAEVFDERKIRSSTGAVELRTIILTTVKLQERIWKVELSLANRDEMGFRMLLGREAVRGRFVIDPAVSFRCGRPKKRNKP